MKKIEFYIGRFSQLYQDSLADKRMYKKLGKIEKMRRSQNEETKYGRILGILQDVKEDLQQNNDLLDFLQWLNKCNYINIDNEQEKHVVNHYNLDKIDKTN